MKVFIVVYQWLVGGTFFLFFLLSSFLLTFIFPLKVMDSYVKWMLRMTIKLLFIKVVIEGLQDLEDGKSYLFLPNHVSFLDIPLFGGFIPRYLRGVEDSRQHKWPVYGWAMKRLGNITIDRSSPRSSLKSLARAGDYIHNGCSVILFAEGGRTSNGVLRPFKKLPFHMAKQAKVEIVPIAMKGMFEINKKKSLWVNPGKIHLKFGKPISLDVIEALDPNALKDHVREKLVGMISELEDRTIKEM
jgi:1-acyl-sn-glycerol-3-phosphate acyltransferase